MVHAPRDALQHVEDDPLAQNLILQIEDARREVAELDEKRKAAWDKDPGNLNVSHVMLNAGGYHYWFTKWVEARAKLRQLEKQREVYP